VITIVRFDDNPYFKVSLLNVSIVFRSPRRSKPCRRYFSRNNEWQSYGSARTEILSCRGLVSYDLPLRRIYRGVYDLLRESILFQTEFKISRCTRYFWHLLESFDRDLTSGLLCLIVGPLTMMADVEVSYCLSLVLILFPLQRCMCKITMQKHFQPIGPGWVGLYRKIFAERGQLITRRQSPLWT